jgi:hypothetical protein
MGGANLARRVGGLCTAVALLAALSVWLIGFRAGASGAEQSSWSLAQMRVPDAWHVSTGQGVTIGIVDSGADPSAPGLAGKVTASADCVFSGGVASGCRPGSAPDSVGHGTIVASVAAQVAPGARFVVARAVAGKVGGDDDVSAAIDWVVDHGAQVVNVSIAGENAGGVFLTARLAEAVERAWARGVVPVMAAGNTAGTSPYGTLDAVVAGATTADGSLAPYSERTTTAKWGLAAPGSVVMVLPGGAQVTHTGTSVAAPNATGALALLLEHGDRREVAVQRLLSTAVPCAGCGYGHIDVAAALGVPHSPPPPPPAPPPTVPPAPKVAAPELLVPDPSMLDRAPSL